MATFYFLFFDDFSKGYGVTILSKEEAEAFALDEDSFDIPCLMTVPASAKTLYIPNVISDWGNHCYQVNEILSDEDHYVIKIDVEQIFRGLTMHSSDRRV